MSKERLEAFSDGVIASIITIMVLELRPPHGTDLESLRPLVPAARGRNGDRPRPRLAFVRPWLAQLVYAAVAALWFVPDRRIEQVLRGRG